MNFVLITSIINFVAVELPLLLLQLLLCFKALREKFLIENFQQIFMED